MGGLSHGPAELLFPLWGAYLLAVLANIGVYLWERTHSVEFVHMHARLLSQVCIHVLVTDCWHFGDVWIVPEKEKYRSFLRGESRESRDESHNNKEEEHSALSGSFGAAVLHPVMFFFHSKGDDLAKAEITEALFLNTRRVVFTQPYSETEVPKSIL